MEDTQEPKLIANIWRTPSGSILQSKHRYDFVQDSDGNFIDGGLGYVRKGGDVFEKWENLCVYSNDAHEDKREAFFWKSYGKDGSGQGEWILLKNLTIGHIGAILKTQKHLPNHIKELFSDELLFRAKEKFKLLYKYDENSKSGLVKWIKRRKRFEDIGCVRYGKKGEPESWVMALGGKQALIHRIIWEMLRQSIPEGMIIDHKDGNPLNNKIDNLRCTIIPINQRNQKLCSRNKSGKCGVRLRGSYWIASWVDNKKTRQKCFALSKYPNAFELACEYRDMKIKEMDCGYTERHGK